MNILIDFLTFSSKTGAGEYQRRVVLELLKRVEAKPGDVTLYALYDSKKGIAYDDLSVGKVKLLTYIDCCNDRIDDIVMKYDIDRFYIGGSFFVKDNPEIANVDCDVVLVNHDCYGQETWYNKLNLYLYMTSPEGEMPIGSKKYRFLYKFPVLGHLLSRFDRFSYAYIRHNGNEMYRGLLNILKPSIELIKNNKRTKVVVVSEYSKTSLRYYFDIPLHRIHVLYSPERMIADVIPENETVKNLQLDKKKYYVMVSAGRAEKNPYKAIKAFRKYASINRNAYLVTLGYPRKEFENHIPLSFLNDADLAELYKNCYALLYPSYFEGFGYPPIEAMHYGKPVLSSNATSMPGILGDAPIYFCPLYESAIYGALMELTDDNYSFYSEKSKRCYQRVHDRQERDLNNLLDMILEPIESNN